MSASTAPPVAPHVSTAPSPTASAYPAVMRQVKIYESPHPAPFFPQLGVFDFLLPAHSGVSPLHVYPACLPAFVDGHSGRRLTRGELRHYALRLAQGVRDLGVARGATACVFGFNSLEWVLAAYALLAAGVVLSPANAAYTARELAHQLADSEASLIFLDPASLPTLLEAQTLLDTPIDADRIVLLSPPDTAHPVHRTLWETLGSDELVPERFAGPESDATALLCYSSGTTGLPKGVATSHYNVTSQIAAGNVGFEPQGPGDNVLCFLPFSHIYGAVIALLQPLSLGAEVTVLPRFDVDAVLRAIEAQRVTFALFIPPVFITLLNSGKLGAYDLSSMRTVMSGAAPLSKELLARFEKQVPGVRVIQGYGMTETTANICNMNSDISPGHGDSVGLLLPGLQARIVADDGSDAPRGELWVRGPCVMKGYHRNGPASAAAFDAHGGRWLKTGDIVTVQDGWWKVVDRKKELIKVRGFQVAPAEVEGLLLQHPAVADAGVVGVYNDAMATEEVRAYIVLKEDGGRVGPQHVMRWVQGRVAKPKWVTSVVVLPAVPKSPSGKILRKLLRQRAAEDGDEVHYYEAEKLAKL